LTDSAPLDYHEYQQGRERHGIGDTQGNCPVFKIRVSKTVDYAITLAEMPTFVRECDRLFAEEERMKMLTHLAINPEAGDVMPDTGGVRKLRWRIHDRGKRCGVRIIYYFRDLNMPLYLLALYVKGEKVNLNMQERRSLKRLVKALMAEHGERLTRVVRQQMGSA
jgi:hypothetical protein